VYINCYVGTIQSKACILQNGWWQDERFFKFAPPSLPVMQTKNSLRVLIDDEEVIGLAACLPICQFLFDDAEQSILRANHLQRRRRCMRRGRGAWQQPVSREARLARAVRTWSHQRDGRRGYRAPVTVPPLPGGGYGRRRWLTLPTLQCFSRCIWAE
jgi:hypothetical protein